MSGSEGEVLFTLGFLFRCKKVLEEWKFAAAVIDRLQLFVFLFVTLTGTLWFMLRTPNLFENVSQPEIIQKLKNEGSEQCAV